MRVFPPCIDIIFGFKISNGTNSLFGNGKGVGCFEGSSYGYEDGKGYGDGHFFGGGKFCDTFASTSGMGNGYYPRALIQFWK